MISSPVILAPDGRLAASVAQVENWYEAARNTPNRFLVYHPVQNARKDLDRFTRQELVRKARYLYKNSPFIRGLIERAVTLTIGGGFHPVFKSGKEEWNQKAKRVFARISRNVHLGPRCSFSQYQRCVGRGRFLDGEGFSLKTANQRTYDAKVQGLEADLICGSKTKAKDNEGVVDGFNLDSQGEVVSYNVRNISNPYDAENIVHHFTPTRLGQYRGETLLSAAINTAIDIDDILALEKDAVKDASSKQDIIKTASGELNKDAFNAIRFGEFGSNGVTAFNLPSSDSSKDDYYRSRFGGQPVVLKKGDEYTPYKSDRPGNAWQGFMAFLANTICVSTLFPPSLLLPVSIGGTDIRRDLDIAQRVVEPWQLDIAQELDCIVDYLMEPEMLDGGELYPAPSDWNKRDWYFPPKLNVDRQQAQQDREDVARGLMSIQEYHARWQQDGDAVDATIILEAKRRKERIKAAGFKDVKEFVQVLSLNPQVLSGNEPQQKTEPTPPQD